MKDCIKAGASMYLGVMVVTAVVGAGLTLIVGVAKGLDHLAFKRKIKKGLKDGRIVEIDGEYYEVQMDEV